MPHIILYTRRDCCLCDEMKGVVHAAAGGIPFTMEEIDVDSAPELAQRYGDEVPVLFIDGRKAFKYRVTKAALMRKLKGARWIAWRR